MSKKYFKKTLAGIFAIAIVTSSVPLTPYTSFFKQVSIMASAEIIEVSSWDELKTKINEAVDGEETQITLTADITASDTDSYIKIDNSKVIVLDLNGYTLDRGLSTATEYGYVIGNKGTLTICDESEKQTGKITGGNCSTIGGGIYNLGTLTINSGSITGNTSSYGGGIYNKSTLTISGGSITGNTSSYGGGIYNHEGTLTINSGSITGNTSSSNGGGIHNYGGTLTINGGSITGNTSSYGGGIYNRSTLTISGGSITGNTSSSSGGGIYNHEGTLTINSGSITENTSSYGGGIYNYEGTLTINSGSITGNTSSSSSGGGIYNKSTLTISGGSITGNTSSSSGGGIYNYEGTLTISGGSITGNSSATHGGGINKNGGTLTINGGNISDNTAQSRGGGIHNYGGTLTINGGNITGNSSAAYGGGIFANASGNITVGGSAIINGNLSTHSSDGIEESNIHLQADNGAQAKLQISETTPLTNSASIGITVWLDSGWDENTDISTFIDGLTADNAKQIFATNCGAAKRETIYYITAEDGKFVTTTEKPAAGNTIPNSTLTWEINDGVLTITGDDEAFPECWVNDAAVEWCDKKDEVTEVVFDTPNLTKLGSAAFYEFPLAKITLPDTLTEIGYAAFKHCAQLESLDIPKGVKEIPCSLLEMEQDESNNWASITSLTSISMASDVTKIDGWAFANCTHVTSFDGLADSLKGLTSLGEGALMGISISDILIYIPETLNQTSIGRFTFNGANLGTDLEIPSFITELGENAFGWANLEHVIIPASVSKIDKNAFIGWGNLKTITLLGAADSVAIDDEAFSGNNVNGNTMTFYVPASQVDAYRSMKALEGSKVIGQATATFNLGGKGENFTLNTDSETKITKPTDPTADEFIFGGWYTDADCTDGNEFDFANALTEDITLYAKWEETATVTFDMQGHGIAVAPITVKSGDKIEEPTVQNEDEYIFCGWGNNAAYDLPFDFSNEIIDDTIIYARWCPISAACGDNLMYKFDEASGELTIYGDGTEIYNYDSEWPDYYGLPIKSIKFETKNLETIGAFAFSCLSDVTDITIPASVKTINNYAFENCESLSTLTFEGDSVPDFNGNDVFKNCKPDVIYVPAGCLDAYKAVLAGYADQIQETSTVEAKGYSVSYNGDVTINFHYLVSESYKNGYVKFSDDTQVRASDALIDSNKYCVFPISMPAKNMYDKITAQFYDEEGNAVGDAVTFDLVTYTDEVKAYDSNYADFVDSFLEYGAQAAAYFGISGAPAGKEYSSEEFTIISDALKEKYAYVNMGEKFVGATLLLQSTPKLRLYYSETFSDAEQNELNPDLFYTEQKVSPTQFNTKTLNGYSVYNYIYKAMNCNDEGLKKLCAALYDMSKAAAKLNS